MKRAVTTLPIAILYSTIALLAVLYRLVAANTDLLQFAERGETAGCASCSRMR